MAVKCGPRVTATTDNLGMSRSVTRDIWGSNKTVNSSGEAKVQCYRKHKYNDKDLYWTSPNDRDTYVMIQAAQDLTDLGDNNYFLRDFSSEFTINGSHVFKGKNTWSSGSKPLSGFSSRSAFYLGMTNRGPCTAYLTQCEFVEDNYDAPQEGVGNGDNDFNQKTFTSKWYYTWQVEDDGWFGSGNWTCGYGNAYKENMWFYYPPYRSFPANNADSFPSTSSNGSIDVSDGKTKLTNSWTYSITKSGYTNYLNYSPTTTKGSYNESITSKAIIEGTTYDVTGSSRKSYTHNTTGDSYSGYIKRYYTDFPDIYTTSATVSAKTYSVPELSSISSNSTISPRGDSLTITLNGIDNKVHTVEATYRTGIWSDYKSKYYIDEASTSNTRTLSTNEIKTMFPDNKADSNGVVSGNIYVTRRNVGVSGGNPNSGTIYETEARSKAIKVYYKPNDSIDPGDEPNDGDASNSGLAFFKNENKTQGAKLPKGKTWTLPTDYNINNMTGVDVKIQYPKTSTSGIISGYKIQLLLPNDGRYANDYVWYETYWYTDKYIYTGTISYNDLKRGISGNRIRITPFYIPSGVSQGSTGSYWYGPTVESKFVDIAWKLNKPEIDCPLNETTWHNHQYRILFKLPKDNDTNYKGTNDIEVHYGSGNYRYQEIQVKINGTTTTIGNNAYINAQNNWKGPTDVSGAKLNYLRAIVINPSLINTYKAEAVYKISVRVRKAYGQNTDSFDGWSDWSNDVTVYRKTVANDVVNRHEYIMASHYMTVQTAFNSSLDCYAKTATDNKAFVVKESFNRATGDNINGPHLSPPQNTPLQTVREYVSEFKDLHQLKTKINGYGTFDGGRNAVKLDSANKLLSSFTPSQEFITAAKDQEGATECDKPETILQGRNYMKYMCDELNNLK